MRLDEFVSGFERDEAAERRRLAEEKSYEITNYLDDVEQQFKETVQGIRCSVRPHPRYSSGGRAT